MDTRFLESGHGPDGGNWGKFLIARYTAAEQTEDTRFPGCEGGRIVSIHGNGYQHFWMLDLATGEGVRCDTRDRIAHHVLDRHRVWVCPLFEPTLGWLLAFIHEHAETWWADLPRTVQLPAAPTQPASE